VKRTYKLISLTSVSVDGEPLGNSGLACHPRCGTGVFWRTGTCTSSGCTCISGWKGVFCGESVNPEVNLGTGMAYNNPSGTNVTQKDSLQTGTGSDNVCPQYPITNTTPQRCGRAFLVRCPMGQCCSNSGFCGGGVLVTSSRLKRNYGADDEEDLNLFYDFKKRDLQERTSEVCMRSLPIWKRDWSFDQESIDYVVKNLKNGLPPHAGLEIEKRTSGTSPPSVCKRLTLSERTNSCKRTNDCCSQSVVCSRMTSLEKKWWCEGKNACCRCPPNPYDPIGFCGQGCQVGFGKCWQTTSTAVCPTTTISPGGSSTTQAPMTSTVAPTTTNGASSTSSGSSGSSGSTTKTATSTATGSTTSIPVSSGSIYGTIQDIVNGNIPKSYSLTGFKTLMDQFSDLRGIANGDDASYQNVTVFAWTNDAIRAWTAAGGPGKTKRDYERYEELKSKHGRRGAGLYVVSRGESGRMMEKHVVSEVEEELAELKHLHARFEARQSMDLAANAKEFLSYSFLPLTVNPGTLPAKALARTLLQAPGNLVRVDTQYMVLTKNNGVIYPFFGASNSTVIDTISCTNGVLFVVSTVLNPPVNPSTTIGTVADLTSFNSALTSLNLYTQLNAYGVPDSGTGITMLGIINEYWTTQDFSDLWAGFTAQQKVTLLNYNILNGVYYSYQLTNGLTLDTLLAENSVDVARTTSGGVTTVTVCGNDLVILDVLTRNGVVCFFSFFGEANFLVVAFDEWCVYSSCFAESVVEWDRQETCCWIFWCIICSW
jgi:hypothetical protein